MVEFNDGSKGMALNLENNVVFTGFLDKPYTRFADSDYQQETFFVEDPNYNVLEIKSMKKDNE